MTKWKHSHFHHFGILWFNNIFIHPPGFLKKPNLKFPCKQNCPTKNHTGNKNLFPKLSVKGFFAPTIAWKYNATAYAKGLLVQRMSHLISIINLLCYVKRSFQMLSNSLRMVFSLVQCKYISVLKIGKLRKTGRLIWKREQIVSRMKSPKVV